MRSTSRIILVAWFFCVSSAAHPDGVPEKSRPTVAKGLQWLVQQQRADGSWAADGGQYPVAMTALAGLAVLNEGSTISEGKYAKSLRHATAWLLARSNRTKMHDGLIGDIRNPSEAGRYMFGHGYAMLFLSKVYGDAADRELRKALHDVLTRAARFTAASQTSRGGWFYTSALEGHDGDEGAVTMPQIHALREARNAGIVVARDVRARAAEYLKRCTTPKGGVVYSLGRAGQVDFEGGERPALTAAALACLFGREKLDDPLCKRWWKYCRDAIPLDPKGRHGSDEYMHFYYAQAVFELGDDGSHKMFPDDRKEAAVTWTRYRRVRFDHLQKAQQADGSWASEGFGVGRVYPTAMHLFVLQLDNAALPLTPR